MVAVTCLALDTKELQVLHADELDVFQVVVTDEPVLDLLLLLDQREQG